MKRKILHAASALFIVVIIMLTGLLTIPKLMGCKSFIVLSGSMEPTLPVGSMVYVQTRAVPEQIAVNDIINYYAGTDGIAVTHRVTEVNVTNRTWTTKGDANNTPDGPVPFSRLVGKVAFHVPLLGYLAALIKSQERILLIITFIAIAISVLLSIYQMKGKNSL